MRVLSEKGKKVRAEDLRKGIPFYDEDCSICYEDAPDPEPVVVIEARDIDGPRRYRSPAEEEIQRLTLENSLLRGELSTIRLHANLSKGG